MKFSERHNLLYIIFKIIGRAYLSLFYKVEHIGLDNLPGKGAAIICSNHSSLLDMFFIGCWIKRKVHYIAKRELFKNPVLGYIVTKLGAFPVNRGYADIKSFRTALTFLEKECMIGIFPEGTRVNEKNRNTIRIRPGVAMIAMKSGAPVVPVAIKGNYRLFGKMKVIFGKPFIIEADDNKKYSVDELTDISINVMKQIYRLGEV